MTPEQVEPLKYSYDILGEECLQKLNQISPPLSPVLLRSNSAQLAESIRARHQVRADSPMQNDPPRRQSATQVNDTSNPTSTERDLYALLKNHHEEDEKLQELWTQIHTVPDWVDWDQLSRGQDVFYRYGGPAIQGLAYQSLLGGMGAARVVEVLARTGGFSTKVARRRVYETTQHILQCTRSLESIQPGGAGFISSVRVRLLHAAVRMRIMKLASQRPEYYSVEKYGVPINDLDSIATIGTFSSSLIWVSFPRQGIFLREQEIIDYIALWRYIAYLVGCPTNFFETPASAKRIFEVLLLYEVQPSEMSGILANNIILSLKDQPPTWASADMLIASARWLNGDELCDALQLPRPSLYYRGLVIGQCIFFIIFTYSNRAIPSWDRKKIDFMKRVYYAVIVDSKTGLGKETLFDFKYVPEFETVTELGKDGKVEDAHRVVDRRNLKYLVIGLTILTCTTWASVKLTGIAVRGVFALVNYGLKAVQ